MDLTSVTVDPSENSNTPRRIIQQPGDPLPASPIRRLFYPGLITVVASDGRLVRAPIYRGSLVSISSVFSQPALA